MNPETVLKSQNQNRQTFSHSHSYDYIWWNKLPWQEVHVAFLFAYVYMCVMIWNMF